MQMIRKCNFIYVNVYDMYLINVSSCASEVSLTNYTNDSDDSKNCR